MRWLPVATALLCAAGIFAQSPEQALAEADRQRSLGNPAAALAVLDRCLASYPDRPLLHLNRGAVLAEQERHEEAIAALRRGLVLDEGHAQGRLTLAKALVASHQYGQALGEIERYAATAGIGSGAFDALYITGLALRHLGRLGEAEAALRDAVDSDPDHADALFNLGAVLAKGANLAEARSFLRRSIALDPSKAESRYQLAQVLRQTGDAAAAERELEEFKRLREREQADLRTSILLRQAGQGLAQGRFDDAKTLYQRVIRQAPAHVVAHFNLAIAYEQLGQGPLAEAMFRKVLELDPTHPDAHLNLGLKLAAKGEFAQALPSMAEALRLAPGSLAARQGLAMVLTRLERPLEALPHFEAIADSNPGSADARLNIGIVLAEAGRKEEALAAFRESARLAPESFRPLYNVGRALNDLGRAAEARQALSQALRLNQDFAPALHLLGQIERAAGNYGQSVELLRRAAEADSENALVHYDLGLALADSGNPESAVAQFERALELDPRHKESLYKLAQILQPTDPQQARQYRERFASLKVEEQDTDRAGTLWNFALAETQKQRWAAAFDLFQQALDVCGECPARGEIHKNFGLTYGHAGKFEDAERELLRAEELLPGDAEVDQALQVVRQARRAP